MTATARKAAPVAGHRRAILAKVHIARKELGLDDDTYRAILERLTGCRSAAGCSELQLAGVLAEFKAKGWVPTNTGSTPAQPVVNNRKPRPADHPSARKARALWISLRQLGVVRNGSDQALEAFATRQLKVERLQWADQAQCYKLIEALKGIAKREGWDQDVLAHQMPFQVHILKGRLLLAQLARLGRQAKPTPAQLRDMPSKQLDAWINDLAAEIQAAAIDRQADA